MFFLNWWEHNYNCIVLYCIVMVFNKNTIIERDFIMIDNISNHLSFRSYAKTWNDSLKRFLVFFLIMINQLKSLIPNVYYYTNIGSVIISIVYFAISSLTKRIIRLLLCRSNFFRGGGEGSTIFSLFYQYNIWFDYNVTK